MKAMARFTAKVLGVLVESNAPNVVTPSKYNLNPSMLWYTPNATQIHPATLWKILNLRKLFSDRDFASFLYPCVHKRTARLSG